MNFLNDKNHIDNFIQINHATNHTYSSTNLKNILSGKSKSIFYAKAIIEQNSFNSETKQKNNNLILDDRSEAHSNPQLEIHNNDVQCTHESTTGQIDTDVLFYMQSRGINLKDCKKLILEGFATEIIDKLNDNSIKNKIMENVKKWLLNVN